MSQIVYRASLGSKSFPFLPSKQGGSIIIPGPDQAYTRWGTPGERERDVNIPHAYYMRNFLPTIEGYTSVGYEMVSHIFTLDILNDSPYASYPGDISAYQYITAISGTTTYKIIESTTGNFYYTWPPTDVILSFAGGRKITPSVFQTEELSTYATVGGATYGFFRDFSTPANNTYNIWNGNSWVDAVPLGLALANITGIVGANGYSIAYGGLSISWSSTTNPIDFVPSLVTGAGGASIQELGGPIRFAAPTSQGFILYTDTNAVSAVYTGNARFPYKFSEIKGAGGFISQRLIVASDNIGYQIAVTKAGLQRLGVNTSEPFLPELADYIFGRYSEEFDDATGLFVQNQVGATKNRTPAGRLRLIDSRYLIYSYNSTLSSATPVRYYDYALVYDMQLTRWGKLKRNHIDIYSEQNSLNRVDAFISSYKSIVLLAASGQANRLILGGASSFPTSVLPLIAFGRYKYVRSRHLIMDAVKLSGLENQLSVSAANLSVQDSVTLESGVPQAPVSGYLVTPNAQINNIQYNFALDGESHTIIVKGAVELTNLELTFHIGGKL